MSVTIRPYDEGDRAACRDLWRELTERHRRIYADSSIGGSDPGRQFDTYVERKDLAGPWVAEEGRSVVGLAGLLIDGDEAEVEPIVVRSDCRSRGIGTRLLQHLETEARNRGARSLSIRPVARNAEAIACFHRNGFDVLGHLEMFRKLGADREWKSAIRLHGKDFRY